MLTPRFQRSNQQLLAVRDQLTKAEVAELGVDTGLALERI